MTWLSNLITIPDWSRLFQPSVPSSAGIFPKNGRDGKSPGIGWSRVLDVINLRGLHNQKCQTKIAETLPEISVLVRLKSALNRCNFPSFCMKPLQVECFECLPGGFGKSLLFQLLSDFLPVKEDKNIVIIVSPFNSIIEDQL